MNLLLPSGVRIFIANESTDLRKSFDGLAGLVRDVMRADPLLGDLYVFRNKTGRRVKILFWDRTGWVLWYKRLESGVFRFPVGQTQAVQIEAMQLRLLLDGIPLGPRVARRAVEG